MTLFQAGSQLSFVMTSSAVTEPLEPPDGSLAELIRQSNHLKIKAYHVDIARDDTRRPGLKLDDIGSIVVPRQSYLKHIDADGTRRFEDLRAEVRATAIRYFNLVLDPKSARGCAEVERGLIPTLDIYESFHLVWKQSTQANGREQ